MKNTLALILWIIALIIAVVISAHAEDFANSASFDACAWNEEFIIDEDVSVVIQPAFIEETHSSLSDMNEDGSMDFYIGLKVKF